MCLLDHGGDVSAGGECRNERSHSDWLRQRQGKKREMSSFQSFCLCARLVCGERNGRREEEGKGRRRKEAGRLWSPVHEDSFLVDLGGVLSNSAE